jgi:hypothetical protein
MTGKQTAVLWIGLLIVLLNVVFGPIGQQIKTLIFGKSTSSEFIKNLNGNPNNNLAPGANQTPVGNQANNSGNNVIPA